jgi:hypothetical protein
LTMSDPAHRRPLQNKQILYSPFFSDINWVWNKILFLKAFYVILPFRKKRSIHIFLFFMLFHFECFDSGPMVLSSICTASREIEPALQNRTSLFGKFIRRKDSFIFFLGSPEIVEIWNIEPPGLGFIMYIYSSQKFDSDKRYHSEFFDILSHHKYCFLLSLTSLT